MTDVTEPDLFNLVVGMSERFVAAMEAIADALTQIPGALATDHSEPTVAPEPPRWPSPFPPTIGTQSAWDRLVEVCASQGRIPRISECQEALNVDYETAASIVSALPRPPRPESPPPDPEVDAQIATMIRRRREQQDADLDADLDDGFEARG